MIPLDENKSATTGRKRLLGKDGEIKGPGPFGAMSLVLLVIFRDLHSRSGPGIQRFRKLFIALSGTSGRNGRDV